MFLSVNDLKKALEILSDFPSVSVVSIDQDNSSGIGAVTTLSFDTRVEGHLGTFTVELSGVEEW